MFRELLNHLDGIEGCIVECGVGSGKSLAALAMLAAQKGNGRTLWGFDSWEAFPPYTEADVASEDPHIFKRKRPYPPGEPYLINERPDSVIRTFEELGLGNLLPKLKLVKGYFSETLPQWSGGPIALLHIDVDLYLSYREVLTYLWPYLAQSGIALFDEYHEVSAWPGAKKAVDEFLVTVAHELHEGYRWWAKKL